MKIALGADHLGLPLKDALSRHLDELGYEVVDFGVRSADPVDYPDVAVEVAEAVADGRFERAILVCGTGIGMSITANRYPKVRAALCHDHFTAQMSRLHNDANILVMGERVIGKGVALEIVKTWLDTEFEGGRHQNRLDKICVIEQTIKG